MKRILFLLLIFSGFTAMSQTDGLVYQAVILDPEAQQIPGADITGNVLPNTDLLIRFTISGETNGIDYQEIQEARTDKYGMIKVIIGQGEAVMGDFNEIDWDGNEKNLSVDINLDGSYTALSNQHLLFIPYSYHRNITATGSMQIDDEVKFKSDLTVDGTTNLNGKLGVHNGSPVALSGTMEVGLATTLQDSLLVNQTSATNLGGTLRVDKETQLNSTLEVGEDSKLKSTLDVVDATVLNDLKVTGQNPTLFTGTLTVDGTSNFNSAVNINNGNPLNLSGDLTVDGEVLLNDDLTVEGDTNLNSSLSVNNTSPVNLSGTLNTSGQTTLNDILLVTGATNLDNLLNVNNASPTYLSGALTVGLSTNLNDALNVNFENPTLLTGSLNVNGEIDFGQELTVNGITNLFGDLFVNNASMTALSGNLNVDGATQLLGTMEVADNTVFNNNLTVANQSDMFLSGTLEVDGATSLNNTLDVLNMSETNLNGTLGVDGITTLMSNTTVANSANTLFTGTLDVDGQTSIHNMLFVTNASDTHLTGLINVDGVTKLNNTLNVQNSSDSDLSGILDVTGAATFNNIVGIAGFTNIQNNLTVTGLSDINTLQAGSISISGDSTGFLASFSNTNDIDNGDGIKITLGNNHGRFLNGNLIKIDQTLISNDPGAQNPPPATDPTYVAAFNSIKQKFMNNVPQFTVNDVIAFLPTFRNYSIANINNLVLQEINTQFNLPKTLPSITSPSYLVDQFPAPGTPQIPLPFVAFPGINGICSGQSCFSVCIPLAGCVTVCIPPVNVCVPDIPPLVIPELTVPGLSLQPTIPNFMPSLPFLPEPTIPVVEIPNIPTVNISSTLSSENNYFTFQDVNGTQTGAVRAQSLEDFANNTVLDDIYVFNVASNFIGIDLADGISSGASAMVSLISEFNKLGVEFASGNGDYSEWLERINKDEYLTAGDIVAVKGGKITKDLKDYEQLMIVSHRPIVLGNTPEKGKEYLGNTVAFIGQVPAKVMGPVSRGDYIVAKSKFDGYGIAVHPSEMTTEDFLMVVGRSWDENLHQGPKMVNTVVGLQNGDFSNRVNLLQKQQKQMDNAIETLESRLERISTNLNLSEKNNKDYASKD